jgi:MFS family permease
VLTSGETRRLTIGVVLAVTTFAFDSLSVTAAMPAVVRDLGGVRLYGAAFSAFMLANLFSLTVAGRVADRRGPQPVLAVGLACFAVGLVIAGLAPSMIIVVVGRAVQGLGAGTIGATAYVVIGRAFAPGARARVFAILSAAWIIPALVAPAVAGAVADHLHWRWVFLGLLPFPIIAAVLALPGLSALPPLEARSGLDARAEIRARARAGLALVTGTALVIAGFDVTNLFGAGILVVAGVALGAPALNRFLPPGTLRAVPILPAVVAVRALISWSFFGTDAFVPLAVTAVRDHSNFFAGLILTTSSLSWSAAAWVQAHWAERWSDRTVVPTGVALIGAGIVLTALVLLDDTWIGFAFLGWSLAGAGMGLAFNATSVAALAEAAPGEEGVTSSSLQVADALGIALATGLGGGIVAAGARSGWSTTTALALVFALTLAAVPPGIAAARRLRATPSAAA